MCHKFEAVASSYYHTSVCDEFITDVVVLSIGSVILGPRSKLTVYGGTGKTSPVVAEVTSNLTVLPVIYLPSARYEVTSV